VSPWPNLANAAKPGAMVATPLPVVRSNGPFGQKVVRFFNGGGRMRMTATGIKWAHTLVYVARMVPGGYNVGRVICAAYPPPNYLIGWWNGKEDVGYSSTGSFFVPDVSKPVTNAWKLYSGDADASPEFGGAGYHPRMFSDGVLLSSGGQGDGYCQMADAWWDTFNISGYDPTGTAETCDCEVAEVVLYDRKLSDAERQQVESYLRDKWFTGTVGASLALPYSVASQVGASRSLPFAFTALVGGSRALPYGTRALAATSRSLPYTLRTMLGTSRALPYAVTTTLGSSRSLSYTVRTAIGGSRSLLYGIVSGIGVSRTLPYGVRTFVGSSRAFPYALTVFFASSRGLPFTVRSLLGASRGLPYSVASVVGGSRSLPYGVRSGVGASRALPYGVLTFVGESVGFAYYVEQAPFIGFSLVMPWKVHLLLPLPLGAAAVARVTHVRAAERVTTVRAVPPTEVRAILREDAVKPDKRKLELVT
jgi:hypothetical protein